jgi:hypothetical protein
LSDTFDTPPETDVLQADEIDQAIPVIVENVLRVDTMPGLLGGCDYVILESGGRSRRLVGEHAQRKRTVLFGYFFGAVPANTIVGVLVSRTKADCDNFRGNPILIVNAVTRFEYEVTSELWVRGFQVTHTSGAIAPPLVTTAQTDILLSYFTEDWAR